MSYRIIEKLNLIAPIVLILDNVAQSIVSVRNSEDRLTERLEEINNELELLKQRREQRSDEDFFEKYDRGSVQDKLDSLEEGEISTQTVEELTIIFDEVQNVIEGTTENADEGIYILKRLTELQAERANIKLVLEPQIKIYKRIAQNKLGVAENLLNIIEPIPPQIDVVLDVVDVEVAKILAIPVIGPPVAKVLELIVDTIDYLILQPLRLAVELGISLLNSINQIYTFEE